MRIQAAHQLAFLQARTHLCAHLLLPQYSRAVTPSWEICVNVSTITSPWSWGTCVIPFPSRLDFSWSASLKTLCKPTCTCASTETKVLLTRLVSQKRLPRDVTRSEAWLRLWTIRWRFWQEILILLPRSTTTVAWLMILEQMQQREGKILILIQIQTPIPIPTPDLIPMM